METTITKRQTYEKYDLEMDARGFLWIRHKPNLVFELEDAISQEKELVEICENKPTPFLIDVRVQNWDAPREAREFHASSKPLLAIRKAEAILVNSLGLRVLANFYNKVNRPPNPVKVFNKEDEAIKWLLKQ